VPIQTLPALATRTTVSVVAANATLTWRDDLSGAMSLLRVRPDAGIPAFRPGQYFALGLWIDGRLVQRPYSAASTSSASGELEFLVRLVPGGELTPHLWRLREGARLRIGPPKGLFTVLPDDDRAHLFVSTGTGLAPFIAMVDALQRQPGPPRMAVVHGAAHVAELAYRGWLEARAGGPPPPAIRYVPAISRPAEPGNAGWHGAVGRMHAVLPRIWDQMRFDPRATVAYLCGNSGMIESGVRVLTELGLPGDAIHYERYWTDLAPGARS
jgi:Na+-transporting NADH:ubiquinone oxidoreductase subunit F